MNPRATRKRRRAKRMIGASGLVVLLPLFEYLGRHDTWTDVFSPAGIAHVGPMLVGAAGVWFGARIHREATAEGEADGGEE